MPRARHETGVRIQLRRAVEGHRVIAWRRERLLESAFSRPLASSLSRDPRFDLHALIELAERGCPPELAVRILAPLEADREAAQAR